MKNPVIYFDGVCGLCNGFIDFVMSTDKKRQFLFSPLQSDFAKTHLEAKFTQDLKTVVLQVDDKTYTKALAVLEVLTRIGGFWKIFALAKFLPTPFLNHLYDTVAENRYNLFGKKETCRLPTPEERQRFVL